jgi:hypothetical protein
MQAKSLIIKNLCPGLAEVGKIKAGRKGRMITSARGTQFQPPEKLDYLLVTTLFRGPDGNYEVDREIHQKYGEKPRRLPVRLLFDDIELNFQCRYACFQGRSLWCSGDGETASRAVSGNGGRQDVPCPCGRQAPDYAGNDKCKINSRLSVLIDGTERVGGVWSLRSTSWNTTVGILSSLSLIKRITGGPLAGLPLELTLNPKTAITPEGKTMNIWVAGIEFKGSIEQLQQIGLDQAKRDALHYARIEQIEKEARLLLAHDPLALKEEADDVVDEFYPDQAVKPAQRYENQGAATLDIGSPDPKPEQVPVAEIAPEASASQEAAQPQNGKEPDAPQQPSGVRRRTKKFEVDPNEWNGQTEIATCGAHPDDISRIKGYSTNMEKRALILDYMKKVVGYDQLSFLRAEEAQYLLGTILKDVNGGLTPTPTELNQGPDDLVECPLRDGDRMSISQYCMTECSTRKKDGWCPQLEDPPANGGLI